MRGNAVLWRYRANWLRRTTRLLVASSAFSHLDKVTTTTALQGEVYAGCTTFARQHFQARQHIEEACSRATTQPSLVNYFYPHTLAILPSWDLSIPLHVHYGIDGTSAHCVWWFRRARWPGLVGCIMTYRQASALPCAIADTACSEKTPSMQWPAENG